MVLGNTYVNFHGKVMASVQQTTSGLWQQLPEQGRGNFGSKLYRKLLIWTDGGALDSLSVTGWRRHNKKTGTMNLSLPDCGMCAQIHGNSSAISHGSLTLFTLSWHQCRQIKGQHWNLYKRQWYANKVCFGLKWEMVHLWHARATCPIHRGAATNGLVSRMEGPSWGHREHPWSSK